MRRLGFRAGWLRGAAVSAAAILSLGSGCASSRSTGAPPQAAPAEVAQPAPAPRPAAALPPFTDEVARQLRADVEAALAANPSELPISPRTPVLKVIHHLQHHPDARLLMEASLNQAPSYREKIEASLKRDGLPTELVFVAEAESAFLAADLKGKGLAVGLWQMIPSTARHYGLHVDSDRDERTDVFKSTDASLRLLVDLHHTFGDWELVITGFYAGAGIVERALQASGTQDAWALISDPTALPEEARGYLPLVLAHGIISRDPARFGFSGQVTDVELASLRSNYAHYYTNRYPADLFGP